MATAVEPSSPSRTPRPQSQLVLASVAGAVYVVAALAAVFYAVPHLWAQYAGAAISNSFVSTALRLVVQLAALFGLAWFGQKLAGSSPPRGIRGGIFLVISAVVTVFFVVRAVGLNVDGVVGQGVTAVVAALLLFFAVRLLTSARGAGWMVSLEEQGWFHAHSYKKSLGLRVRRLTTLGILLVGGSGVYSLTFAGVLPDRWVLALPFTDETVTVLTDLRYTVPILLLLLTGWVAYRAVNLPTFAEFLIATEAEMNKVSWTSRKRLAQDTAVVLVTTFVLTLFLLVVDLFWGWLLSQSWVGVLPSKATGQDKAGQVQEAKW